MKGRLDFLNNDQFDFALDLDDPATLTASSFMTQPAFSSKMETQSVKSQVSYLITDIRLRNVPGASDGVYGFDKWGVDIYHRLAGFESKPGVNTQCVDYTGKNIYNRYDNREITPDTVGRRATYTLSAREADLLMHAGAYDHPAETEAELRKNLVGQTYFLPDQVQMTRSHVVVPVQQSAVSVGENVLKKQKPNEFDIIMVNDTGTQTQLNAGTRGSNLAFVMNNALRTMTPGVTPMADIHNDLDAAKNAKALSRDHQIEAQVLDSELDLGDTPEYDDFADLNVRNVQPTQQVSDAQSYHNDNQVTLDEQSAANYQDSIMKGAADQAGLTRDEKNAQNVVADVKAQHRDEAAVDDFLPEDKNAQRVRQVQQNRASNELQDNQMRRAEQAMFNLDDSTAYESADEEKEQVNSRQSNSQVAPINKPVSKNLTQDKRKQQTVRQQNVQRAETVEKQQSDSKQNLNNEALNVSNEPLDVNDLQSMLDNLKAEGVGENYQKPDYEAAAKNSPAAQRQRLKVQNRLRAQEASDKAAANQAVANQARRKSNVPSFDGGPDF